MAYWPPTPSGGSAFVQQGQQPTTLVWGTEGIDTGLGSGGTYIVKSARYTERVEEIDIENGTGFEATVILLLKGENVEFTVVDDLAITPPTSGTVVTLDTPYATQLEFLVVETNVNAARKTEGERTITAKSFAAINLS